MSFLRTFWNVSYRLATSQMVLVKEEKSVIRRWDSRGDVSSSCTPMLPSEQGISCSRNLCCLKPGRNLLNVFCILFMLFAQYGFLEGMLTQSMVSLGLLIGVGHRWTASYREQDQAGPINHPLLGLYHVHSWVRVASWLTHLQNSEDKDFLELRT